VSDVPTAGRSSQSSQPPYLPLGLWGLLVLTVVLRMPGIDRPLLGNFATKSVVNGMMARNWAEGRTSLWYPKLDLMMGDQRSLHMAEFPVSTYLSAVGWKFLGGSLDVWGRAMAVAFLAGSVAVLYSFVRRRHGAEGAFGAGLALTLSPIAIIYGQNFTLDASMVFFTVVAMDGLDRWMSGGRSRWLLSAAVGLALLLLSKIYLAVWLLPLAAMVVWPSGRFQFSSEPGRRDRLRTGLAAIAGVAALLPAVFWYIHVYRAALPESPLAGITYTSLQRNAEGSPLFDRMLLSPDFYRQVLDDLTGVILTPLGFMLFCAGFLDRSWRRQTVWLLAAMIVVAALPVKFFKVNYYYVALLPPLCIVAGLGWQVVCRRLRLSRTAIAALVMLWLLLSLRYAVRPAFVTPQEDMAVVAAGQAVQQLTVPEEAVVTIHGDGIDLLYYCNRPGWAVSPKAPDLDSLLKDYSRHGARYLVIVGRRPLGFPQKFRAALMGADPFVMGGGYAIYCLAPCLTKASSIR